MAGKVSPTLRVLHELRDGQRGLERAQAETNERLERLTSRVDSLEVTVARELRAVATVLIDVRDLLRDRLDIRDRVENHEQRIASLERRTG